MTNTRRFPVFNEVLTLTILFFLTFGGLIWSPIQGQSPSSQLKTAKFYFVTPTATVKTDALRKECSRITNQKQINRLESRISAEQMEADSFSKDLIHTVESQFKFAEYEFIPDTSVKAFIKAHELEKESIILVRRAKTESGVDALILFNLDMQPLTRPVPYYARLSGLISFVDALFGQNLYNWRDLDTVISKWSERLQEFSN
ncbi:MAG: hypothetical protein KDC53_13520 [Saprospiraceae bacterium]|nr:hypothetical protein [Saprospiraceae bacterium]